VHVRSTLAPLADIAARMAADSPANPGGESMIRNWRNSALLIAAIVVVTACGGAATSSSPGASAPAGSAPASEPAASQPAGSAATGGSITVTSLWGGSEQESFQKVLDAFTAKTGITAKYESIRTDYATVLQTRITGGNPPDVSILPGIGFLRRFARDGSIKKIADIGLDPAALEANYAPGILDIGKVDGDLYAIMVKFNSKSTLWYRPDAFTAAGVTPPTTWDEFKATLATLKDKSLGLGTSPDTWTLTDWFESIYLRQSGADKYDQLFSGKLPWTDPSVATAVTAITDVLNDKYVAGGIKAANGRAWVDGIGQVFGAKSVADMYYEGGFVGGIATGQVNKDLEPGKTIDWVDFPSLGGPDAKPVTIGGDVIAALTDKPGVKEFIEYMTTADAGSVWAATGAIISPVKAVDQSVYPTDLVKREAAQVTGASVVKFDGSDLLPAGSPDLGAELQKAIAGSTVDWASFETQVKTAWSNE
jgi:alpha-glucoside transport system substrate-binding protein